MNISRRQFLTLPFAPRIRRQESVFLVAVLEVFDGGGLQMALLVHHADPQTRKNFAQWLRMHPKASIRLRDRTGHESNGLIFRVRLCFGRGLIVLSSPLQLKEREVVTIIHAE
jgi:hypothetical protein